MMVEALPGLSALGVALFNLIKLWPFLATFKIHFCLFSLFPALSKYKMCKVGRLIQFFYL